MPDVGISRIGNLINVNVLIVGCKPEHVITQTHNVVGIVQEKVEFIQDQYRVRTRYTAF